LLKRITEHDIDRTRVSRRAVAVIEKLRGAGFDAYLVGGCVRDLLLGKMPKDFDVATDATPEDVRHVFPRVRLVGRRFRIVHVRMGREIMEVSTFRGAVSDEDREPHLSDEGMILRDNHYGTIDQDAFRRDFTVNALYYDPTTDVVLDYCGGMKDIASRTLRLIGDPKTRFREDPVRILRAIRFSAKLGLKLHRDTEAAIAPMCEMLNAIPAARLFDEFTKLFLTGHGERAFELLSEHELVEILFPLPAHGEAIAKLDADIYFLGPPYKAVSEYAATLAALARQPARWVIAQHPKQLALSEQYGSLRRVRVVKVGSNRLSMFRHELPESDPAE